MAAHDPVTRAELADVIEEMRQLVLLSAMAVLRAAKDGGEGDAFDKFLDQVTAVQARADALRDGVRS